MKKTLSTVLVLMLMALCVVSCDSNTTTTSLQSIEVTTKPAKLTYTVGESLNTADMVVTATYSNGTSKVVTGFTVDTSVLSTVGTKTVTVSFTQNGVTRTASFVVTVKYPPFTVTFVKNDASAKELDFEAKTVDYGKAYGTLPGIKKDNYTFLGWYDAPSGGNKVTENTTVTKASNHNLYAQWIENGKFRVTFKCENNDNPTETVPADITGYLGQKIILPGNVGTVPLTRTGYTFAGWALKDESYDSGAFITASEERLITLYAQWTYSVTYNGNGNTGGTAPTDSKNYLAGSNVTILGNTGSLTKTGYTFDGWNTQADGNGNAYAVGATVNNGFTNGDTTLYAKWKVNEYTITYKDKDGETFSGTHGSDYPTKHTYGTDTTLVDASKNCYTFDGWYTDSACSSGNKVTTIGATAKTADFTLYAQWKANEYTITYKDKGDVTFSGTHGENYPTKHTYDTDTTLVNPTKTGYAFAGWYTDSACSSGNKVTTIGATDYTADFTLYAKWNQIKGTADVSSTAGRTTCNWVQLWEDGPKFAEFNVGSTITDYKDANSTSATITEKYTTAYVGGYYTWGGTKNKDSTYPKTAGTDYSYSESDIQGMGTIGTDTLGDTAKLLWGSNWKMPTNANINNLRNYNNDGIAELNEDSILTVWTWCDGSTTQYVTGCTLVGWKVTGKGAYSSASIFLPAAGYYDYNFGLKDQGTNGRYWSSTPFQMTSAFKLVFGISNKIVTYEDRYDGYPVRAILAE